MQPLTPRGPGAGALVLAFVAGALGGAAAALIVSPRGAPAGGEADPGLRQSIAALDGAVRELGARMEELGRSRPPPPQQPSQPLTARDEGLDGPGDVAPLLARLDDIARLMQSKAAGGGPGFIGAAALPPLDLSRATADRSKIVAIAGEDNEQRSLWRQHAFWTCQQVLDAYGMPDRVEASDGAMTWEYETTARTVTFQFYEGMLINIWS